MYTKATMNATRAIAPTMSPTMTENAPVAANLCVRLASRLVMVLMDGFIDANRSFHGIRDRPFLVAAGSR